MKKDTQKSDLIDSSGKLPETFHRFSHNAMATVFEIIIVHDDAVYAEQSAFEAFGELDRLEQELSRFIENSDISRINNSIPGQQVPVGFDTYNCLSLCKRLNRYTKRAFDVSVCPLINYWSSEQGTPLQQNLTITKSYTGMRNVKLDKDNFIVKLNKENMCIDLGGIGKGYAVDRMAEVLSDWDIKSAMVHGGTSSVFAVGAPPGEKGWHVRLRNPKNYDFIIGELYLKNEAISGSGIRKGRHIINPRTAYPVSGKSAAWALCPTAAVSDALSTAFMVMPEKEISDFCLNYNDVRAVIIKKDAEDKEGILRFGEF